VFISSFFLFICSLNGACVHRSLRDSELQFNFLSTLIVIRLSQWCKGFFFLLKTVVIMTYYVAGSAHS
jgi:hypothetical protein